MTYRGSPIGLPLPSSHNGRTRKVLLGTLLLAVVVGVIVGVGEFVDVIVTVGVIVGVGVGVRLEALNSASLLLISSMSSNHGFSFEPSVLFGSPSLLHSLDVLHAAHPLGK